MGLEFSCTWTGRKNLPRIVTEFYANFYEKDMEEVFLRGRTIPVKPDNIRTLLNIPRPARGKDAYEKLKSLPAPKKPWDEILQRM